MLGTFMMAGADVAAITPDGKVQGPRIHDNKVIETKVITLLGLLLEGPEATWAILCSLATSDHRWVMAVGNNLEATQSFIRTADDRGVPLPWFDAS
jgi:hypothetical protein